MTLLRTAPYEALGDRSGMAGWSRWSVLYPPEPQLLGSFLHGRMEGADDRRT